MESPLNGLGCLWVYPRVSVLGPLVLLIFMNDLPEVVEEFTINHYDTIFYSADANPVVLGSRVEGDLGRVVDWISSNSESECGNDTVNSSL